MRRFLAPLLVATALLGAAPAMAHSEISIPGKVMAVTAKTIDIVTHEGQIVTLDVDSNTRVMMGGKRLTLKDVKVGQTVEALGYGDSMTDLVAIDVTIIAQGK